MRFADARAGSSRSHQPAYEVLAAPRRPGEYTRATGADAATAA